MSNNLTDRAQEIVLLQKSLNDLQSQLAKTNKRILELTKDKTTSKASLRLAAAEELKKERQLLVELETQYNNKQFETTNAIEDQIADWPDAFDSKPKKRFKPTGKWS